MKQFLPLVLLSSFLLNACVMEETSDLASLLVGRYIGTASDDFSSVKKQIIIITRINDNEIEITSGSGNLYNTSTSIRLVQDGNWIRHSSDLIGVSFEAKAANKKVPLKFSTNVPVQSFEGALEK